jgi:hypothetical protein
MSSSSSPHPAASPNASEPTRKENTVAFVRIMLFALLRSLPFFHARHRGASVPTPVV